MVIYDFAWTKIEKIAGRMYFFWFKIQRIIMSKSGLPSLKLKAVAPVINCCYRFQPPLRLVAVIFY
ncbi:hypothetical protein C0389_06325 [bacterium]|nr:hypothetical protein [bacterium]